MALQASCMLFREAAKWALTHRVAREPSRAELCYFLKKALCAVVKNDEIAFNVILKTYPFLASKLKRQFSDPAIKEELALPKL